MTTPSFVPPTAVPTNVTSETNQGDIFSFAVQLLIVVFIMVLGILGNGFVCYAFFSNSSMRSLTNSVMVSLAFSDLLLVTILGLWITMDVVTITNVNPKIVYNFLASMDILCTSASMLNLALVSIDRYIAVVYSLSYALIFTRKLVKKLVICIWSFSFFVAILGFTRQFVMYRPARMLFNQVFMSIWAFLIFIIPTCIIVFGYGKVAMTAWKQVKWSKKHTRNFYMENHQMRKNKKEVAISLNLLIIILPFCSMWGVYFGITLYEAYCLTCRINISYKAGFVIGLLPHIVASVNPIIYIMMTRDFRIALRQAVAAPRRMLDHRRIGSVKPKPTSKFAKRIRRASKRAKCNVMDKIAAVNTNQVIMQTISCTNLVQQLDDIESTRL